MYNREEKEAAFSIHYDEDGAIINVTSKHPKAEVTKEKHQELPPKVKTDKVVNTTIIIGEHNPRCRYIWVPGWGYVWVCW
jgi:hypothetical protein